MKSSSSLYSQNSGPSVTAGLQQHTATTTAFNAFTGDHALITEDPSGVMKRACSDAELLASAANLEEANHMTTPKL